MRGGRGNEGSGEEKVSGRKLRRYEDENMQLRNLPISYVLKAPLK